MRDFSLRTVLAGDETVARRILEEELAEIPGLADIGQADNGRAAAEMNNAQRPDVVLLDIQMPGCDGFEVVRRPSPLPPAIVFVTAFDQHALHAFDAGAAGYLLEPVRQDRLRAEGELVWIITGQKRFLASHTLRELATRFEGPRFRRIHRSVLINVDHVRKMSTLSSQRWLVTMSNEMELIVSKRQAHTIREVLHA